MQQLALRPLPPVDEIYDEVENPIPNIFMVELKAYKISNINIRAIIGQKHWFWMCLHGDFECAVWLHNSVCKRNPASTMQKRAGWQVVSLALSQRSAETKGDV